MISSEQFAAAFAQYGARIHRFLKARGASEEVAEELTAQTWLLAWKAREQWRGANLRGWLFTIAHNCWRDRFRREVPMQLSDNWDAPYEETFDRGGSGLEAVPPEDRRNTRPLLFGRLAHGNTEGTR